MKKAQETPRKRKAYISSNIDSNHKLEFKLFNDEGIHVGSLADIKSASSSTFQLPSQAAVFAARSRTPLTSVLFALSIRRHRHSGSGGRLGLYSLLLRMPRVTYFPDSPLLFNQRLLSNINSEHENYDLDRHQQSEGRDNFISYFIKK